MMQLVVSHVSYVPPLQVVVLVPYSYQYHLRNTAVVIQLLGRGPLESRSNILLHKPNGNINDIAKPHIISSSHQQPLLQFLVPQLLIKLHQIAMLADHNGVHLSKPLVMRQFLNIPVHETSIALTRSLLIDTQTLELSSLVVVQRSIPAHGNDIT